MGRNDRPAVTDTWQLKDAKARLGELVKRARPCGPQRVTTRGGDSVIVVAEEQYQALIGPPGQRKISDALAQSNVGEMDLERRPDYGRDGDL